jgi:hypothetical protein
MHDDHPAQLQFLIDGYLHTQLIALAIHWGIPESLSDGPRPASELATEGGIDPITMRRVLAGLSAIGVFEEAEGDAYRLTAMGQLLRTDVPNSMRGAAALRASLYYQVAAHLHDALSSGRIPFEVTFGADLFSYLSADASVREAFQASMSSRSRFEAEAVVQRRDFSEYEQIVDIGGGYGILLEAVLMATPTARGTLFDQPRVIERAIVRFGDDPLTQRISFAPGDFFDSVPAGGDAYVLSRVLHDWDDERCALILRNLRSAMPIGSTLFLVESVMPVRAADDPAVVNMDIHMLLLLDGRERTEAEFEQLLREAGFALERIDDLATPMGASLIEARAN